MIEIEACMIGLRYGYRLGLRLRRKRMKVKTVFHFPNGMVAVCDEKGEQIPELQGKFEDVREKVMAAADQDTEFNGWWPAVARLGKEEDGNQNQLPRVS